MRKIKLTDTVYVAHDGKKTRKKNNPVIVYDTAGPYSTPGATIDIEAGIPRIREEWSARRKDVLRLDKVSRAKEGKNITQMYYAKRRIITPEMEYVAVRENQQIEDLGLKSYITPDFVRKEVAAGRAVIPANINHPEAEPMIIGKKFLVKVSACIDYALPSSAMEKEIEKAAAYCFWGSDVLMDVSAGSHERREYLIRNSPVPIGSIPLYQALEKVGGQAEDLSWEVFRDTLIEQAGQGVDFFSIHAAVLRGHADLLLPRLSGIASLGGTIISKWMKRHKKENFLYTHFAEICEILKAYDAVLSIGDALCAGSIYDANDSAQLSELPVMGRLASIAWDQFVQVMTECSAHIPMNKIAENVKERQYACHGVPFCTTGMLTTDAAQGYEHIASAIGGALTAWNGTSMIGCATSDRNHIIANKIAAHAADLAKGHPGAQVRDNALSKARFESRLKDQANLSLIV